MSDPFDEALAASYVGKYILVGLSHVDREGRLLRQEQLHGVIESASRAGIRISLRGARAGETWNMPPLLEAIRRADRCTYTLRSTGESIENPDLVATWIVEPPGS